ncbi:MAG: glutathione S-transferase N-terminal domain-containing protein [Devosia sp.]
MIRLLNAPTSPFGRKVVTALLELDLPFTETFVDINVPSALDAKNPLRQVPTLIDRDGTAIYDSTVIVGYLDSLAPRPTLFDADRHWEQLTAMSLADGLMEAVRMKFLESRRPHGERSEQFITRLSARIDRSLHAMSDQSSGLATGAKADSLAIGCALRYTEFRHGYEWRKSMPALADWLDAFGSRLSMQLTEPDRGQPLAIMPRDE